MVQRHRGWQGNSLSEVDHPDAGLPRCVVHEEKRAAHNLRRRAGHTDELRCDYNAAGIIEEKEHLSHLMRLEEVRLLKDRAQFFQPLQVKFLPKTKDKANQTVNQKKQEMNHFSC